MSMGASLVSSGGAAASAEHARSLPLGELGARLYTFNYLPSLTLHPARRDALGDAADWFAACDALPAMRAGLHRRWSRTLLAMMDDVPPVEVLTAPALAIALLPRETLDALAHRMGLVLCSPGIRRIIVRDEVARLRAAWGHDELTYAQQGTIVQHAGLAESAAWDATQLLAQCDTLGEGALLRAFDGEPASVRARVAFKFAPEQTRAPMQALDALQLALDLLTDIDTSWRSLFPETL